MKQVYLDNNATTKVDKRVIKKMNEVLEQGWGNPSSLHYRGQLAKKVLEESREIIASFLKVEPKEIIFTSGGTESNNLAIFGAVKAYEKKGKHLLTSKIEHRSVLKVFHYLEHHGYEVDYIPVDSQGRVELGYVEKKIRDDTALVSVMFANNEIGTIQPVREIVEIAKKKGAIIHCDAVQALGKVPFDLQELGVDLASFSAHKIYAPKGIGALFVRRGTKLVPLSYGGHQERGRRPGTENIPCIAGFAEAIRLIKEEGKFWEEKMRELRDYLEIELLSNFRNLKINGASAMRIPNTSNILFPGMDAELILMNLDMKGIAVSTGSACQAGSTEPSYVIKALGIDERLARGALRISLGKDNTKEEINYFVRSLKKVIELIEEESKDMKG